MVVTMATLLLVRHGRTHANTSGVLAGWTPGVELDEQGRKQVDALASRTARLPVRTVVSSPLHRCRQTAEAVLAGLAKPPSPAEPSLDERLGEARYGEWEGQLLKSLAKEPLWKVVQQNPSGVTFPGGESLSAVWARAVEAVREWDARIEERHGPDALWVAVSHGDVIKSVVADALGLHLDQFQRVVVDPASICVIRYTPTRPFVVRTNDSGGDLSGLVARHPRRPRRGTHARKSARARDSDSDAAVGGGAGAGDAP